MNNIDSLDSPRPELGGSHHLPPYSILCVVPPHPLSKLSRFGLPRLWEFITPSSDLRLGWGLKQTCSYPQGLSNGVLHSICTHRDQVDSQLFVVGSQTASLTPGPSFDHNFCCKCPNGLCKAIFDIYTSRPFQWYKEHLKARCFDFYNWTLKLRESQRTPSSHFWECEFHPHTCLKVGLRHMPNISASGLFGMGFEHLRDCFRLKDIVNGFPQLFQLCFHIAQGHIPCWITHILGAAHLLTWSSL